MSRLPRFGSALSALALAGLVAGCAGPFSRQGSASASKAANSNLALATRAQMALSAGDFATAIGFGERAVENSPNSPTLRTVLGNAYFGAGRFASAEAAYRDSLALALNQPKLVLKLALVQIAQGKSGEALAFLNAARGALEPADYGLALALAGQPSEAVLVLEPAARLVGADARVRQNLALAYGLSGDWAAARTVAAQDLPSNQVDARVQQWMALANPVRASDQVAALVGVTPAPLDPGQPLRLALRDGGSRLAQLVPPQPAPVIQAPVQPVEAAAPPPLPPMQPFEAAPAPAVAAYAPPPAQEPVQAEHHYQAPSIAAAFEAPPAAEVAADKVVAVAAAETAPPPPLVAALAPTPKSFNAKPRKPASKASGNAGVVVQLGAYSSTSAVESAWDQFADRFGNLRNYTPTSARFDRPSGTLYRLSVKGFGSVGEASGLCSSLRRQGKTCFVRRIAGDSPVNFASR